MSVYIVVVALATNKAIYTTKKGNIIMNAYKRDGADGVYVAVMGVFRQCRL